MVRVKRYQVPGDGVDAGPRTLVTWRDPEDRVHSKRFHGDLSLDEIRAAVEAE